MIEQSLSHVDNLCQYAEECHSVCGIFFFFIHCMEHSSIFPEKNTYCWQLNIVYILLSVKKVGCLVTENLKISKIYLHKCFIFQRMYDDEDEDSFIDDSDSEMDSFVDDSTTSPSNSSDDGASSGSNKKKKKKRKTRGNKGSSSSGDE